MDCIKIIESLIEKAGKDADLKKRLLEDSDKAIYQETGKLLAAKVKFLQDKDGKLTYEIVSKAIPDEDLAIPDEDLEGVFGGKHDYSHKKEWKLTIPGKYIYPEGKPYVPVLDYAAPGYRTPEELRKILERLTKSGQEKDDEN